MAIKQNIGRFVLSTTILSLIVYIYIFELTPTKIISYENKNQHHSISSGYANQGNCLHTQKSRKERIQQYCSQKPVSLTQIKTLKDLDNIKLYICVIRMYVYSSFFKKSFLGNQ